MQLLDSEKMNEDCLDFVETHGYITASIISPIETTDKDLIHEVLGCELNQIQIDERGELESGILGLRNDISRHLFSDESLDLPCDLDLSESDSDIEAWCVAFMEKHMMEDVAWFANDDEEISNMLLPIILVSGLIEDEEIEVMRKNESIMLSMLENIPEVLPGLYSYYHQK